MLGNETRRWSLYTIAVGILGGCLGVMLQLPVGALLGSISAVLAANFASLGKVTVPKGVSSFGRALIGIVLGSLISPVVLVNLRTAVVPAVLLLVTLTVASLLGALLLAKIYAPLDRRTAVVACAPGGMSEMLSLGDEIGAQGEVVLAFHLARKLMTLMSIIAIVIIVGE